ncbi:MAG: 2-phospho-L-lactate guanylyltransferase [Candidatus Binataceae bacterium]
MRIVLVAAKQLALAKSRLAPALPVSIERAALAEAMFRDVLAAALSSRRADRVAVVTSDPRLIGYARVNGAIVVDEEFPRGLNVAVRMATTELIGAGATAICTVLSDIPLTTSADIDAALAAHATAQPGVVLIPSRDCSGTNMIVRTPPDVIATQFGRLSLVRHREDCRRRAIPCQVVRMSGPALDLDVPADLIEFARTPTMTHTFANLGRLGLLHG